MKVHQFIKIFLLFLNNIEVNLAYALPRRDNVSRLIVVSFDGFRGDYLSPTLTPTLWAIKRNGVTGQMFPLFPSKTFPNHFSIATGLFEESHGIVDNQMYDPEFNEVFDKTNLDSKWWDNGYSLPLWIANELSGGKSGVIMWPGCCTEYHGINATYMYKYKEKTRFEDRVDILFDLMTRPKNPANLVFLYINQPDSLAHVYGPYSRKVLSIISKVDRSAAYLLGGLAARKLLDDTNIIFLSDHGMNEITRSSTVNLTKILDTSLFRSFGESQTIGILPNDGKFNQVYDMLLKYAPEHHYRVYLKSQVPQEYFYRNHRRIMPIILEAEPGYEITFSEWVHKTRTWGNHGNNNTQADMRSLFIGVGSNFKKGYEETKNRFFNIDLYPIMAEILNIDLKEYKHNGTSVLTSKFLKDNIDVSIDNYV